MFKNYFKTAWRNISRNKIYTVINILGLALGICSCVVIFLITSYDFSFDKFHPDRDRIYRIVGEMQNSSGQKNFLNSPINDVGGFQNQIPGFDAASGIYSLGADVTIPKANQPSKKFNSRIEGSYVASNVITWPQYFDIFNYKWLAGNAQVLNEPFKVVLTENRAHQYFGNISVSSMIGRSVIYDDSLQVSVAGVVKDWTGNTDFGYTDFISISTATHSFLKNHIPTEDWNSLSPHQSMAFVKLAPHVTPGQIDKRFAAFIKTHVKLPMDGSKLRMYLQPLSGIHFTSDFHRGDDGDNFRKAYLPALYALMGVALFILIIAAVNFINLSTAQSIQRAKEIGVRKVLGSGKRNIIFQFLTETFLLTLCAVSVSLLLVKPMLYVFKDYIPEGLTVDLFSSSMIIFLLTVTIATTLLAGFYPAKVLASYLPVLSLKGTALQKGTEKLNLRKALIVFQFTISLIFIVGALVIGRQIGFMNNADKGFNTDDIITLTNWNDKEGKLKVLAHEIKQIKGVEKVLMQNHAPMGFAQMMNTFKYKGKEEITTQPLMEIGNDQYIPFYQMKLIAGRNMVHSDSLEEFVINEAMAKELGFKNPREAVGKLLYYAMGPNEKAYPIVGVIADFHEGSFHEAIQSAVIVNDPKWDKSIAIKLAGSEKKTSDVKSVLSAIEAKWKKIYPETPFDFSFLDESITRLYGQEEKTAWLVNVAMSITIFISCMGLFGLGMFTAQKRTKEIGIRKVLGASVANIAAMLSKDFIALIMIAIIIANPIAYYLAHQWLQDFVYRTQITWWIFVAAGLGAILIALITVSFQAIKAAIANPAKSLRTE
jgi:putative ABC transport system permease protein